MLGCLLLSSCFCYQQYAQDRYGKGQNGHDHYKNPASGQEAVGGF
jgi:hypothetical protein